MINNRNHEFISTPQIGDLRIFQEVRIKKNNIHNFDELYNGHRKVMDGQRWN